MTIDAAPADSPDRGGGFLLAETDPAAVLTPEDAEPEARQIAAVATRYMDGEVLPQREALERQEAGSAVAVFRKAGELGLLAMEMPEAYGGLGLNKRTTLGAVAQLGRLAGVAVTHNAHTTIGAQPLIYFGTAGQKEKYLPRLATGEWMGAFCLTEASSGSDALGMKARAMLSADGRHYLLKGEKMWITNAAWADLFTVFAKVDGERVTAFLVERGFPGVSTGKEEHKLGIKSSSTRRLILEDARVPVENVLGEVGKGAYIAFNALNSARYSVAVTAIGAARDQIRVAANYARERRQFGRPIISFGLIQQKLADMAAAVYGAESAIYRTADLIDRSFATGEMVESTTPPFPRALEEFAVECAVLKVRCTEILFAVADESLQIHGGYGFSEEFSPARVLRDSRINRIFDGTNEINRLFVPTTLLRRDQKGRLPLRQAIAVAQAAGPPPAPVGSTDPLERGRATVRGAKGLLLVLLGTACETFQAALDDEQEVLAAISDVVADIYLAESAVLRALKVRARPAVNPAHADLAVLHLNDAVLRIEASARRILERFVGANEIASRLAAASGWLHWRPIDTTAVRRRIAARISEHADYPL